MTSQEIQAAFLKPFGVGDMKFLPKNVKGNRALAMPYISARAVEDRLDEVVGVANWQDEYQVLNDGSAMCQLRVRIDGEWVTKCDVGSPSEQPDAGDRLKAAFSDALKRAAVKYGIGRFLYRLPPVWCDYDPQTKQFTKTPQLPDWVLKGMPAPATQQQAQPRPQPAPQGQPPALPTQQPQPPVQKANPQPAQQAGDVVVASVAAVQSSTTATELEAAVFAVAAHNRAGRIDAAGGQKVGDAIQSKALHLIRECKDRGQLDALHGKLMPLLANPTRQAAVLEAFNAKLEQVQQPAVDFETFA